MIRLLSRAVQHGAVRTGGTTWDWKLSGNCRSPATVERTVRPPPSFVRTLITAKDLPIVQHVLERFPGAEIVSENLDPVAYGQKGWNRRITVRPGAAHTITLRMEVMCRKCENCLERKRRQWAARALAETRTATRTWLVTLTLSPTAHYTMWSRATAHLAKNGIAIESLPHSEQFAERHSQISRELTLWLKRVRKESKTKFRYLLVCEAHASGLPHYHALVHEVAPQDRVTKRTLQAQWYLGFSQVKLVTSPVAATYVCKYLAKSTLAKVRASVRYGESTALAIASVLTGRENRETL